MRESVIIAAGSFLIGIMAAALIVHFVGFRDDGQND